ncbi:angiotensin-converting enzyme 2-like [Clupea harengus]|uniref:Angiotensin-converting enzyme 2-like n=1 Tax=Clupea harengus TaxID=7950 RepID=A0A6P8EEX2_CLUHA|nr:angiotensin-converting enzyme 2-like [Clupea harengus]
MSCDVPLVFSSSLSRGRFNSAFQLSDDTLEFEGLLATLAPPAEQPFTVWLVVFGVVMGVSVLLGIYLITMGIVDRRRKSKRAEEENPVTNPYDNTDEHADGISNKGFERDSHDQQTVM